MNSAPHTRPKYKGRIWSYSNLTPPPTLTLTCPVPVLVPCPCQIFQWPTATLSPTCIPCGAGAGGEASACPISYGASTVRGVVQRGSGRKPGRQPGCGHPRAAVRGGKAVSCPHSYSHPHPQEARLSPSPIPIPIPILIPIPRRQGCLLTGASYMLRGTGAPPHAMDACAVSAPRLVLLVR